MPTFRLVHVCTVPQTLMFLDRQTAFARAQGCEVHAVASPGEELAEFAARTGATVHAVPMSRRITPLRDLGSLGQLVRVLRGIRPEIVHGHTPKGGLLAMIAAALCRVPVRVYHLHGLPLATANGMRRRLLRGSERVSCRLAQRVFCVSPSLRAAALAERLCPPEKMRVLGRGTIDGIDAEGAFNPAESEPGARAAIRAEYGIPRDALVIGFVGRLVRDKGIAELARAWQMLRAERPDLHLFVVGPTEAHDPPPPEFAALHGDERVHRTGDVAAERMPDVYRAMDVLTLPTYREGFGTVLLEAAATALPVVATQVTGCVDAVRDGETGTLVPARDAAALAAALHRYLDDPALRRRHGAAGRARVLRDFQPRALSEALYAEYLQLLRENGVSLTTVPRRELVGTAARRTA